MGNQCGDICRGEERQNPYHKVIQQYQQTITNQSELKFRKAITNPYQIAFPLSTNGDKIVDGFGRRVKLAFVTWRGCETNRYCIDGINMETVENICENIKSLGFNGVRIIYSVEMVLRNPIVKDRFLIQGSDMINKSAMSILDIVINKITKSGLIVILSNYCSSPCLTLNTDDGEGLWWTDKYSEYLWLDCSKHIVQRYSHNPRVVGFQLRTNIRGTNRINPTWGDNNVMTDWRRAAQVCANQMLSINDHCLIFIGGLNYGCQLKSVKDYLLDEIIAPRKIVYTGSFLPKHWSVLSWRLFNYEKFIKQIQESLVCIKNRNHPLFINHFSHEHIIPWQYITKYLQQTDLDWCFWYLDNYRILKSINTQPPRLQNESIKQNLYKISRSNIGVQFEQKYVTCNLPQQMISSNAVEVHQQTNGYNVDELLQSTPGASLDDIRQQQMSKGQLTDRQQFSNRGNIYIDDDGMIQKPPEVIKQYDN